MNENNTLSDQLLLSEAYQKIIVEEGIALQVRHIEHSGVRCVCIYTHIPITFFIFHKRIHL